MFQKRLSVEQLEDRRMLAPFSVSNLNDSGVGSLRDAIAQANAAAGADTISFAANLSGGTINLTGGELVINEALSIDARPLAANVTINANQLSRIINITPINGGFFLGGLKLTGGKTTVNGSAGFGAAIRSNSREDLVLSECQIIGNTVTGTNSGGGGIFSRSLLKVEDSVIENNSTTRIRSVGGGIYALVGTVSLEDSIIENNSTTGTSSGGGGIYALAGTVSLERSIVRGNRTSGSDSPGGGIWANDNVGLSESTLDENKTTGGVSSGGGIYANSDVHITHSTVSNNSTSGYNSHGGGISSASYVSLTLSTLSGNSTAGSSAHGGGIYTGGSAAITSSTVTDNRVLISSSKGGGIYQASVHPFSTLHVNHSILAGNSSGRSPDNFFVNPQGFKFFEYSVFGGGNNFGTSGVRNIASNTPGLGPLADNGGPTKTHALLLGSPAINAGNPSFTGDTPYDFDQRGDPYVRNVGSLIDIGAYELPGILAADFDEDGDVDGRDFLRWQRSVGILPSATHSMGDANGDRDVTRLDLMVWQNQYGTLAVVPAMRSQVLAETNASESSDMLGVFGLLSSSVGETVSDKQIVSADEYRGEVDQAIEDLGNPRHGTARDFGEIAVRRAGVCRAAKVDLAMTAGLDFI